MLGDCWRSVDVSFEEGRTWEYALACSNNKYDKKKREGGHVPKQESNAPELAPLHYAAVPSVFNEKTS